MTLQFNKKWIAFCADSFFRGSVSRKCFENADASEKWQMEICHLKMVVRSVDKTDEIRAYIHARSILGCSLKQLTNEISTAYGPSCFWNRNHSLLGGNTNPDMHLDLPCISTLLLCTNRHTVTPLRSGYIGWNFAFLTTGSTSRAWNEHF